MRIAINAINDNARPRGPDRYAIELLKALTGLDAENEYLLFHAPWQDWYPRLVQAPNLRFVCLEAPRSQYLRIPWQAMIFPLRLRRFRPDVVHLPNTMFILPLGYRIVITFHDLSEFTFPEKHDRFRSRVRRLIAAGGAWSARRIVAVSQTTKADLVRILGITPERIRVVLEGAGSGAMNGDGAGTRSRYALHRDYLLYVGQIERTKNVEGLVRAFAGSEELRSRFDLVLVGQPGNAWEDVTRLIRDLAPHGEVRALGYVPDEDLAGLFPAAAALVFPSLAEGFGLVVVEAMARGVPVVAARAGSLPEVAGDAALLVPPGEERALEEAMRRVLSDGVLRADLIRRGRERAACFSWTTAAREMLNLYHEAGAEGGR